MNPRHFVSRLKKLFGFEERLAKRADLRKRIRPAVETMEDRITPTVHTVNGAGGADFLTIQAAINDPGTVNGDTIQVAVGTYAENVVVNKQLTLLGAKSGVDARGR